MTVSERVGVSCLSAVLGSVLPLISALAHPAGFQTNSPEHVARSAVPAGPPAALQSCRPQCKQVAVPPRSKNGHAEWVSGDRKKISKIPTDLQPCLCSPKNGDSSFGLSVFFFRFLCGGVLCDTSTSCHLLSLLWRAGVSVFFSCVCQNETRRPRPVG